jgi:hypothetical protein
MNRTIRILFAACLLATLNHQLTTLFASVTVFVPTNYHLPEAIANSVLAADVNGDGNVDLVTANSFGFSSTLIVWTNNGNGVFGSNATLAVGSTPVSAVAADINGDGKIDLISANAGANTLTVLTNNGNGVFGSNATLKVGNAPNQVIAVDIDNNGKVDLIAANTGTNTLTVLTNNGSGVFGSNATLQVGNNPVFVTAADINGDGEPDLICADYGTNTLTVLTNNGSGIFGSNATLNVGVGPTSVLAEDINNDGKLDLICANNGSKTLTILTNNGFGIFGSNTTVNLGLNLDNSITIAAADVYGHGKMDLICAYDPSSPNGALLVLTNNGSGVFGSNVTLTVTQSTPEGVVAADVNHDGKVDLIVASQGLYLLTVFTQMPVGSPTLNIQDAGTNAILSWSSFSTGFALQTNTDLTTTNWGNSAYPISILNNTNESVTITSPPPGNLFFRLKQ